MIKRIATMLFGKFESHEELSKFLKLALMFGLIIGTYWAMRPIKDSIFDAVVGGSSLYLAKILSIIVIAPLVVVYSKLIDKFARHKVFYGILACYIVMAALFALAFMHPTLGLANKVSSPDRLLGWAWYVYVESFGSFIVALFWVITTDITMPESAKRGFPIVSVFGQLGNLFGPWILSAKFLGFSHSAPIVAILAVMMILILFLMYRFMNTTPQHLLTGYHQGQHAADVKKDEEPGFLEGLKLLFSHTYLMGIFFIVSVYEIIITVIDYHFKQAVFASASGEVEKAAILQDYASYVGLVALVCLALGVSNIQRKLGMLASLIMLPILVAFAIVMITWHPSWLQLAFWIMVFSKAVNYALNQPTMKQLYIPTSKEARYKSQGWIEMFGSRSAKAMASGGNGYYKVLGANTYLLIACVASLGLVGVWMLVALSVSKQFNKAIANNEVVC